MKLNKYVDKVISDKKGLTGLCIGYLSKSRELVIKHEKGGQIAFIKAVDASIKR